MSGKNYFKVLDVDSDASADDIRIAYKKQAKLWHPDKNHEDGAEEKFKEILEAYNYLQSDDRRQIHAREVSKPAASQKPTNHPQSSQASDVPSANPKSTAAQNDDTKSHKKTSKAGAKQSEKHWWESFHSRPQKNGKTQTRPKSCRSDFKPASPNNMHAFMNSFMGFSSFTDPFDEILFDIFLVTPTRVDPKPKPRVDPFGNKMPQNVDSDLYDWKSATKPTHSRPEYQEYLDHETEFTCHHCGLMMTMDILRKHEPRCKRLGGRKRVPDYDFDSEETNAAYSGGSDNANSSEIRIKCQWCGSSIAKRSAPNHIVKCKLTHQGCKQSTKRTQSRPEWNNDFTETGNRDDPPQDVLFGRAQHRSRPSASSRISVDDFDPYGGHTTSARGFRSPGRGCWKCQLDFGVKIPAVCPHIRAGLS